MYSLQMKSMLLILLFLLSYSNNVFSNEFFQDLQDEAYRIQRAREDSEYIRKLEEGEEAMKPYFNQQFDREHGYESSVGY